VTGGSANAREPLLSLHALQATAGLFDIDPVHSGDRYNLRLHELAYLCDHLRRGRSPWGVLGPTRLEEPRFPKVLTASAAQATSSAQLSWWP